MNRRRMMMLQAQDDSGIEIPAEYKRSFAFYNLSISWNNDIVTLSHLKGGFTGPTSARLQFIGTENKYAQSLGQAFSSTSATLPFLDSTKLYKLTLTAVNVSNNSTDSTEDVFIIGIGIRSKSYYKEINIKDITVGTKIELEMTEPTGFSGAVFGCTVGSALWSFDFRYCLEEV
ncbi:MAG: hypothetical protein IJA87_02135 [Clostridia bacterium]|nr:hypothetical protein [Clostridia bacterium]